MLPLRASLLFVCVSTARARLLSSLTREDCLRWYTGGTGRCLLTKIKIASTVRRRRVTGWLIVKGMKKIAFKNNAFKNNVRRGS